MTKLWSKVLESPYNIKSTRLEMHYKIKSKLLGTHYTIMSKQLEMHYKIMSMIDKCQKNSAPRPSRQPHDQQDHMQNHNQ